MECAILELMRRPHTEGLTDICLRVPSGDALRISKAIQELLNKAGESGREINAEGDEFLRWRRSFLTSRRGP